MGRGEEKVSEREDSDRDAGEREGIGSGETRKEVAKWQCAAAAVETSKDG